jgi:hypothetical protein
MTNPRKINASTHTIVKAMPLKKPHSVFHQAMLLGSQKPLVLQQILNRPLVSCKAGMNLRPLTNFHAENKGGLCVRFFIGDENSLEAIKQMQAEPETFLNAPSYYTAELNAIILCPADLSELSCLLESAHFIFHKPVKLFVLGNAKMSHILHSADFLTVDIGQTKKAFLENFTQQYVTRNLSETHESLKTFIKTVQRDETVIDEKDDFLGLGNGAERIAVDVLGDSDSDCDEKKKSFFSK